MKKIRALLETLVCIFLIIMLSLSSIVLFAKYNGKTILIIIPCVIIVFILAVFLKLFFIPSHMIIKDNKVKVFDFPFFATNKFYVNKRGLILHNSEINLNDVKEMEIIKLTSQEKKEHIGYKHLFNKYLKVDMKYGQPKYVYVGNYSKKQIDKIIKILKNR